MSNSPLTEERPAEPVMISAKAARKIFQEKERLLVEVERLRAENAELRKKLMMQRLESMTTDERTEFIRQFNEYDPKQKPQPESAGGAQ